MYKARGEIDVEFVKMAVSDVTSQGVDPVASSDIQQVTGLLTWSKQNNGDYK